MAATNTNGAGVSAPKRDPARFRCARFRYGASHGPRRYSRSAANVLQAATVPC